MNGGCMKTYLIADKKFSIKDLTLKESKEINKLLNLDGVTDNMAVNFDNEENIKKFLAIVLIDENGRQESPGFFDNAIEKTVLEVVKDFFLIRINQAKDIQNFLISSITKRKK